MKSSGRGLVARGGGEVVGSRGDVDDRVTSQERKPPPAAV
jgi:hypothetical protein